jgi:hypothetical protein
MEIEDLKLCIELVPSTSSGLSLSSTLKSRRLNPVKLYDGKDWYSIQNERKEHAGWKCEICGAESDFEYICGKCTRQDDKCNNCVINIRDHDQDQPFGRDDLDFHNSG